jgi:hypothetical protein
MVYVPITPQGRVRPPSRAQPFLPVLREGRWQKCMNDYDTNIMGRFTCRNRACPARVWTSKQIAITIRRYSDNRYNARVYHQSCKSCGTPSKPELDRSYAERVAYRIKKWCGVQMDAPPFSGRSDGPHRSDLCEGCKQGHCSRMGLGL